MRLPASTALITLAIWLVPATAPGQGLRGVLLSDDAVMQPIASAIVILLGGDGSVRKATRTDTAGRFGFAVDSPGTYRLRSIANGFAAATTPIVDVPEGEPVSVRFFLLPVVVELEGIEVEALARPLISDMRLQAYHERRRSGMGFAITREQIEKQNPRATTDLLRQIPGVRIRGVMGWTSLTIPSSRMGSRTCNVKIFLDGIEVHDGHRSVDDISPWDIEGIEVFRGLAVLPPEFGGQDSRCGAIAIWTRAR